MSYVQSLLLHREKSARQLIRHGNVTVNNKKVNIASYLVKVGDVINQGILNQT